MLYYDEMIVFITGNSGKFAEVKSIFGDHVSQQDIYLPEIQSLDVKKVIGQKLLDARKVITEAGFGPDYKVPGLPHRTGHGIGLDGHEWTNFVRGNKTLLQPGMCFSDEPMIAIYGEFGIRLEDCLYLTETGAKMFTKQSSSIERPFA